MWAYTTEGKYLLICNQCHTRLVHLQRHLRPQMKMMEWINKKGECCISYKVYTYSHRKWGENQYQNNVIVDFKTADGKIKKFELKLQPSATCSNL